jgi:hypothetical protein
LPAHDIAILDQATHRLADRDPADTEPVAQPIFIWELLADRELAVDDGSPQL